MGSYAQDGDGLTFAPTGTTMMACPEALMNQERGLLDLLPRITGWRMDGTAALVLTTADGVTITARHD